ncbi:MAG: CpaD family pilus assembly protein [Hyphomicrobiaceae bacterium]|nr:CpaD family pilus assembly protein [Hyphomicrobiaceae bacterium]
MKMKSKYYHGSRTLSGNRALCVGTILFATVTLAACNTHREKGVKGWLVADPTARHPILVGSTPVVLDLPVARGSYGLAQNQGYELRHFLRSYKQKNEGPLTIAAPSGGSNEIAVMHALGEIKRELQRAGISRHEVHFAAYSGAGTAASPIKVSYNNFTARGPECGDWSDNLARDPKNIPYRNFGCATQRNLAAMISNPRDLVEPRGMTPRDSQRRDVIMDKYVKGDTTVAKKSNEEKAKVSEVSGGGSN